MAEFKGFPKLKRLFRDITVTEKIDGTNACVVVLDKEDADDTTLAVVDDVAIWAQSRTRFITPDNDNYGFARWVQDNAEALSQLGPGHHFGEWWGKGIQRNYGVDDKRFSLFNPPDDCPLPVLTVPVLYQGEFDQFAIESALISLKEGGSIAAPGFDKPEGIVVYHHHGRHSYKITLDNEDKHKWEVL